MIVVGRFFREGSKATAERFLRSYQRPERVASRLPPEPDKPTKPKRPSLADTRLLRELIVEHLGRGVQAPMEIYQSIVNDYGSLHIRRFWRVMRYLVDEGIIERLPEGYKSKRVGRRA